MNRNTKQKRAALRKAGDYVHGRAVNSNKERTRRPANPPRRDSHPFVEARALVLKQKGMGRRPKSFLELVMAAAMLGDV